MPNVRICTRLRLQTTRSLAVGYDCSRISGLLLRHPFKDAGPYWAIRAPAPARFDGLCPHLLGRRLPPALDLIITVMPFLEHEGRARGARAEDVAAWYFRLNGFFSIPGFVVHLDRIRAYIAEDGTPRYARTEADLMAVRFPFSREIVGEHPMTDDVGAFSNATPDRRPLFVLVEVKAGLCRMNGPWTNREARNMQRVLRRFGFTDIEAVIEAAAADMYDHGRWDGQNVTVQYVCVGGAKSPELARERQRLVQLDWEHIGRFLHSRFSGHPEKLPDGFVHDQWPNFGRAFGEWFFQTGKHQGSAVAGRAVAQYVRCGTLP